MCPERLQDFSLLYNEFTIKMNKLSTAFTGQFLYEISISLSDIGFHDFIFFLPFLKNVTLISI